MTLKRLIIAGAACAAVVASLEGPVGTEALRVAHHSADQPIKVVDHLKADADSDFFFSGNPNSGKGDEKDSEKDQEPGNQDSQEVKKKGKKGFFFADNKSKNDEAASFIQDGSEADTERQGFFFSPNKPPRKPQSQAELSSNATRRGKRGGSGFFFTEMEANAKANNESDRRRKSGRGFFFVEKNQKKSS